MGKIKSAKSIPYKELRNSSTNLPNDQSSPNSILYSVKMTYLLIAAFAACLVFLGVDLCLPETAPIVETKYGFIEGTADGISRGGRHFYQFRGIQYAVVEERFKPSVEPKPWKEIKSAKEFGPACWNVNIHKKENCLYLNVYTPSLETKTDSLLPVAVYVHGGSFQTGTGENYGPNYLIDENIILVTLNYRLGILGFLSTENEDSPGNYGLKDQVMALKWVQENIHAFGGNSSEVTLFGQSAGSASVTYHLVSPMSKGLFKHAIAQSGSFLDPWSHTVKPLRHARKLGKYLGCDTSNTSVIIECLKKIPPEIIAPRQLAKNMTVKFFEDPIAGFGPTVEPVIGDGSSNFLNTSPYDLLVAGKVNKVPLMTGLVQEEGIYLWAAYLLFSNKDYAVTDRNKMQDSFTSVAPLAFYFDEKAPSSRLTEIARKVQDFYFGSSGFALDKNVTFFELCHVYSDRLFVASVIRFMNLYSKLSPTYPYLYTFNKFVGLEFGWEELHEKYHLNATHAADLDMIVSPLFQKVRKNPVHDETSRKISKLWASFMRTGVPSATYGSERNFPPIQADIGLQKFYRLDIDTELRKNEFAERIAFWESLKLSDNDFNNCSNC